jgi:2,3-bisphosphoglycerate-independent phosphoglycerate mutase
MQKVLLVILDGWGHSDFENDADEGNAVEQASVPRFRALYDERPRTRLACSGNDVGLPAGQMGNSEVGHLNLGAGRIVHQDIARVDAAIEDGSFAAAVGLDGIVERLRARGGALHLVGLLSEGGVHSHIRHFDAVLDNLPGDLPVRIHCITDGRDTSPTSGAACVARMADRCAAHPSWHVATVGGRYYAMDRDKRWDRTERAYRCIVHGKADSVKALDGLVEGFYGAGVTDEFLPPTVVQGVGEPGIGPDDAVLLLNFRADRMRQICAALTGKDFEGFPRDDVPVTDATSLTEYEPDLPISVAFPPRDIDACLAEVLASASVAQLRVAETEKYAHVTYFFNGGVEDPFSGEERVLIPSPKVATYDLQPEMSARGVADAVVRGIEGGQYGFILVNFANPDMVGHTGVIPAAVQAVETVDACLGDLLDRVAARPDEWVALVTADHGNCEKMLEEDGRPHTAHTSEPVDFFLFDPSGARRTVRDGGRLADVAPTVLQLMGLAQPEAMTGRSLVPEDR